MPTKRAKTRSSSGSSKRKSPRALIALAAIAVAASAAVVFLYSNQSRPTDLRNQTSSNNGTSISDGRAQRVSFEVVNSYPHDPTSFTQGLLWREGGFFESTGQYGQSKVRRLEFPSGRVLNEIKLAPELFGEGLALVGDRLVQLTWQSHRGFVYGLSSFRLIQEFTYSTEGWGLTYDGTNLILSDGSSDLFYLDPQTFKSVKKLAVRMNGQPVPELNELEFIDGEIWSNVWQTDLIVRINPATGAVTSFLDLRGILPPSERRGPDAVLNGIAHDGENKRIFVTGKLWPRIFEIRLKL